MVLLLFMRAGVVYCTLITARLAHQRLKVPWERLRVVPLNSAILVRAHAPDAAGRLQLFDNAL